MLTETGLTHFNETSSRSLKMKCSAIPAMFASVMLVLIRTASAAPTILASSELPRSPAGIIKSPTSNVSTIEPRSPFGMDWMQLGTTGFQPCFPNDQQANMCTLTLISHPSWNNLVKLYIYDNECKRIGENLSVPRDMLASKWGWGMSSELPKYLVISIARDWDPSDSKNKGVQLDYGDFHFRPFWNNNMPFAKVFTIKGYVDGHTIFRAAFPR